MQKTYTVDFLTKARKVNHGIVPQYYVQGSHEAIIPKETFRLVQEEILRRKNLSASPDGKKRGFSSVSCFSNLVFCGLCGDIYRRIHWNNRGKKSIVWRCATRLAHTGKACAARTISEDSLKTAVLEAINAMLLDRDSYMAVLQANIAKIVNRSDTSETDAIDQRLLELQTELIKKANSRKAYDDIADEIFRLRELKEKSETDATLQSESLNRITRLYDFLNAQPQEIVEFDEMLVRRILEKVTVSPDHMIVNFKSGISIDAAH